MNDVELHARVREEKTLVKQLVIAALAATSMVVLATNLRSEPLPAGSASPPPPEPITGEPAPATPTGPPLPSPFDPPDTGGPEQGIQYEDLSPEDQAVMDQGRDVDAWINTHAAFRAASVQRADEHAAEIAARKLGLPSPGAGVDE